MLQNLLLSIIIVWLRENSLIFNIGKLCPRIWCSYIFIRTTFDDVLLWKRNKGHCELILQFSNLFRCLLSYLLYITEWVLGKGHLRYSVVSATDETTTGYYSCAPQDSKRMHPDYWAICRIMFWNFCICNLILHSSK